MANKQTTKPGWLFDKKGNIRTVHLPVNGKGETISLNPATMTGGLHDSVGFAGSRVHDTESSRFYERFKV